MAVLVGRDGQLTGARGTGAQRETFVRLVHASGHAQVDLASGQDDRQRATDPTAFLSLGSSKENAFSAKLRKRTNGSRPISCW